jgi:uncharacterized Tic20 family protein
MNELISKDERTWGMFAHLSAFAFFIFPFGNILGPLVVWLIKKDDYSFVDEQGKEAINFQISMTIYGIISTLLVVVLVGIALLIALFITTFVLTIIAGIKANEGLNYRYPLVIRVIK